MSIPRNFKPNRCYHLINRIAHRAPYLSEEERARFVARMWRVADFSGLTVLAYCFMSNHFHIFVHLPEPVPVSDAELMDRTRALYTGERLAEIEKDWSLVSGTPAGREAFRKKYLRRMGNVSEFMKTLKLNTTISFNDRKFHVGTMWESRFRARVYNPGDKETLATVAAYIDRNPVKAGIVTWPDAYPWCSFAAACKGDGRCVSNYGFIYSYFDPSDWPEIRKAHEQMIARKLKELEEESEVGEKRGRVLPRGLAKTPEVQVESVPRLVDRGSNKVALSLLLLLQKGPLRPAELRQTLGIASATFFTRCYLTPLESSGHIELADGSSRFSSLKQFRLTRKGVAVITPYH